MPSQKSIATGLKLIESDKSKLLGLKVGSHENVEPGQYIPRAGKSPERQKKAVEALSLTHIPM